MNIVLNNHFFWGGEARFPPYPPMLMQIRNFRFGAKLLIDHEFNKAKLMIVTSKIYKFL
jgi:hypothetical protein